MIVVRRSTALATGASLLGLLALAGCGRTPTVAPGPSSAVVETVRPTPQTLTRLIEQPGFIKSYEQTPIYAKIAGFVQEIKVDKGYHVHKGDTLLTMWVPEMEQELAAKAERVKQADAEIKQADASLLAAEANISTWTATVNEAKAGVTEANAIYRRWQAEFERGSKLLGMGTYDKQTLDEVKSQLDQSAAGIAKANAKVASSEAALVESKARRDKASADVTAAKAKFAVAHADKNVAAAWLDYRNIRAPFDGVVTARNVNTGAFLQSSSSGSTNKSAEPLFVMMRLDIMRVTMQVPEYDAVLVKTGMPALIRFQALPAKEFRETVTLTTWAYDDQARTLQVECHLHNPPDEELRPGMYANVTLTAQVPDALTIPSSALMADSDGGRKTYCFIIKEGRAVRTAVRVGVRTDKLSQVLQKQDKDGNWEKFSGEEAIVAFNPDSLIDGQEITVGERGKPGK